MFIKVTFAIASLALVATGCGSEKTVSDADAAALQAFMGPSVNKANSGGGGLGMKQKMRVAALLSKAASDNYSPNEDELCDGIETSMESESGEDDIGGVTCAVNACEFSESAQTINIDIACTAGQSFKYTCGEANHTMSKLTFALKAKGNSSGVDFSATVSTDITGTALNGPLSCGIERNINESNADEELSDDDLECKYNGAKIPPAVVKASMTDGLGDSCTEEEIAPAL